MKLCFSDPQALSAFGERLAEQIEKGDVIALSGSLGAGKTTLARGILRGLGYIGEAPSPSFALVQGYEPPDVRLPVAHIDLYRLETPAAAEELGLDDWLSDGALMIEWPEHGAAAWLSDALWLTLSQTEPDGRSLTARALGAWEKRWSHLL